MKNRPLSTLLLTAFTTFSSLAGQAGNDSIFLDIRIFTQQTLHHATLVPGKGKYLIYNCRERASAISPGESCHLSVNGKKVRVKKPAGSLGSFDTLRVVRSGGTGHLKVRVARETRVYDDDLVIFVKDNQLILINRVFLEHYTAGVVESEGGNAKNPEFYKLQCMISRTYALRNIRKHEQEGFHLCDQVHCQLYQGRPTKEEILAAVDSTCGLVILGPDTQVISAAFHSNSGGQTMNSEDVWSLPSPYLKSIQDTFSLRMPMAAWEARIPKGKWLANLKKKYNFPVHDSLMLDSALRFTQPVRRRYYPGNIPLKDLRSDFNLRSTFFDIEDHGDDLLFRGRGYGHGIGVSQEGALNMARQGYNFEEMIRFYYRDVRISTIDSTMLPKRKNAKP